MTTDHRASAFGLTWHSDIALDGFDPSPATTDTTLPVCVRHVAALADRGAGRALNRGLLYPDGIRFGWDDEVVFDMIDGDRIDYLPGPAWRGALPPAFYSTIAALTIAWRGAIPFHACTVAIDGCAVLIAGRSGAGKSSLTAGLLGIGARLVADDLSVIRVASGHANPRIEVLRGRPTMRQHPEIAARIDADLRVAVHGDPRGKWLVRPRARAADEALPLAGLVMLTGQPLVLDARAKLAALTAHLFRPRWLAALPDQASRGRALLTIAAAIPMTSFPAIATFDPHDQEDRAHRALDRIRTMIAARSARTSR